MSEKLTTQVLIRITENMDAAIMKKLNECSREDFANKTELLRKLLEIGLTNLK